jgi:hypothetical protein
MSEEDKVEKAVEVILPEEAVTEVELGDNESKVKETEPKVKVQEEKDPEVEQPRAAAVDEREKALNDLRKQYEHQKRLAEAEREARKAAEEYARQQAEQISSARGEVQDSNLKIILNAIDATESAASNAERDYAEAMAAGDYSAAAKAQRMIAQAESHLLQLQNGKQRLEESLQQTTEGSVGATEVPSFEPKIPQDPIEVYASRLAPKSAQWLREHPEVVSQNKVGKLTRAHQDAVEDGLVAESPEYFRYIESRLGYDAPTQYEEPVREAAPVREAPKKSLASAPVSSNGSVMSPRSSGNSNTMVLSSAEVEMAILAEPELPRDKAIESYARNKAFLIKQGKLSA